MGVLHAAFEGTSALASAMLFLKKRNRRIDGAFHFFIQQHFIRNTNYLTKIIQRVAEHCGHADLGRARSSRCVVKSNNTLIVEYCCVRPIERRKFTYGAASAPPVQSVPKGSTIETTRHACYDQEMPELCQHCPGRVESAEAEEYHSLFVGIYGSSSDC